MELYRQLAALLARMKDDSVYQRSEDSHGLGSGFGVAVQSLPQLRHLSAIKL